MYNFTQVLGLFMSTHRFSLIRHLGDIPNLEMHNKTGSSSNIVITHSAAKQVIWTLLPLKIKQ